MTVRLVGGDSGTSFRSYGNRERKSSVVVNIPAGPDYPAGTIRKVDLNLVTSRRALDLVRKRHQEDEHPEVKNSPGVVGCLACTKIGVRMLYLTEELDRDLGRIMR
jgi:hypothetical protein